MTMYQVSQRAGISYSTIQTTKKRGGQLKIDTIERICEALDISLSVFFQSRLQFRREKKNMENYMEYSIFPVVPWLFRIKAFKLCVQQFKTFSAPSTLQGT